MKRLYVGSDVAKAKFDVALHADEVAKSLGAFQTTPQGYKALAKQLAPYIADGYEIHLVAEPSGTYHLGLIGYAHEQGWSVSLPNPVIVRQWGKGQGVRVKNDKIDARTLAHYGYKETPTPEEPLPTHVLELDLLLRRQADLAKMIRQERNRLESFVHRPGSYDPVLQSLHSVIEQLAAALALIQQTIKAHLKQHPDLAKQRTRLLSVPGVGEKGVLKLLVFLYRWDAHTAAQGDARGIVAFAGLDPVDYASGSSVWRRPSISKMGDGEIRRTLYMSALGGVQAKDSPLVHFYTRLVARGKPKKLSLVASARKILTWAFGVFRSGGLFEPAKAMPKSLPNSL